jgi:rhodanese-related sulfurtransferase
MSYTGDVSVKECWENLIAHTDASLVDVRTMEEWSLVGVPHMGEIGKSPLFVSWQKFPYMEVDVGFVETVKRGLNDRGSGKDSQIYMICRSGVRSMSAASALCAEGYINVFNVLEGFEGDVNAEGHRSSLGGWKYHGLPWRQQ